ncbi:MAG TPA: class I SAM-dependent methyltransferase [Saprospiraceae bacterium]|nr:class I SAM-dependent methyltransferase [Saprospiraceae bacterium]
MNSDLTEYYAKRAAEYEAIYNKPERQSDLSTATKLLQEIFKDQNVLEIACGTGFWTEKIARTARFILATDINESVLEIARNKNYPNNNVQFEAADLYRIQPEKPADALFGGFIWSHIKIEELGHFTDKLNALVKPGSTIVLMDNRFVPGSNTPIAEQDAQGNTYQSRKLQNGESYLVLKNFPEREAIEAVLTGKAQRLQYIPLHYFWICVYQTME